MFQEGVEQALDAWEGFYLILGGAGAALTGLQFVVMTLLDGARNRGDSRITADPSAVGAFGTPTVVHFCAVLLVAGVLTAPWAGLGGLRATLVLAGAAGLAYAVVITLRARRQRGYKPVLEDWLWHALFPVVAYGGIMAGAMMLHRDLEDALFVVGGMTLFLIFIGIHNAWDTVTYLMIANDGGDPSPSSSPPRPSMPPRPQAQGRRGSRRR
jgi:hypothetical protein